MRVRCRDFSGVLAVRVVPLEARAALPRGRTRLKFPEPTEFIHELTPEQFMWDVVLGHVCVDGADCAAMRCGRRRQKLVSRRHRRKHPEPATLPKSSTTGQFM